MHISTLVVDYQLKFLHGVPDDVACILRIKNNEISCEAVEDGQVSVLILLKDVVLKC